MSIEPLLQRIASGDQRVFAQLVDVYQRPLFGFCGSMGMGQATGDLPDLACRQAGPAQALHSARQHARRKRALRQLPMGAHARHSGSCPASLVVVKCGTHALGERLGSVLE